MPNYQELRARRDRLYPQVRDMRTNGWPKIEDIAAHFGLPVSTVRYWCADLTPPEPVRATRELGINRKRSDHRDLLKPRARELAATTTMSWKALGAALGVSPSTVFTWCHGVERPDGCRRVEGYDEGYEELNRSLRNKGFKLAERIRMIDDLRTREARHAA